ncbi:MAG: DUF1343 domain-containing protein [Pirellulales bacterium]|nr:DUF1343 domain-containing protein [Pirellulales bacterium]
MKNCSRLFLGLVLFLSGVAVSSLAVETASGASGRLVRARPEQVGMDSGKLAEIDAAVADGIRTKKMPGCVVAVGHGGKLVWLKAYGHRQLKPKTTPMAVNTVFDLASVTKPVATATSVMVLVERGKIELDQPVAKYLPEFGQNGKEGITVRHLLTHQGGLIPDNSVADYRDGPEKAWQRIWALKPIAKPGTKYVYSDVGFIVLGKLVERVSGMPLDVFARQEIFGPLGMHETGYRPGPTLRRRAAVTEQREGRWMQGEVHDPRAYKLDGVAGHAGLFSTAQDLAQYAQMLLGHGQYNDVRVLRPETIDQMTTPHRVSNGFRALGWDYRTAYSSNRGKTFSPRAFGHGGFTGTSLWIDPGLDLFVIFLSNRVHPDGHGFVNPLAGRIGTIAANAVRPPTPARGPAKVRTGIDVLRRDGFSRLAGRRVGLITNDTGRASDGISTARILREAKQVKLVALFSPEHGLESKLDVPEIGDTRDPIRGLPVYSLYGKTRKPTPESLQGIDTLVFDIQDVGCRFYTYISTMGLAMQAASERGLRFVVLDRPNPVNGLVVEGPVLDDGTESFVAFHRLPIRHGMTVGELALLFKKELHLKLDLDVVRLEGWRRSDDFDATGLPWVNPSPNMRSTTEAFLYPGVGLLETTNVSVGRGTPTPFEVLGAPWLDGRRLADALAGAHLPGVRFRPVVFQPDASTHAGKVCGGIELTVTDRVAFRSVRTGLEIARQLRLLYPDQWDPKNYNRLLGSRQAYDAILAGRPVNQIEADYQKEQDAFRLHRAACLLYPETKR